MITILESSESVLVQLLGQGCQRWNDYCCQASILLLVRADADADAHADVDADADAEADAEAEAVNAQNPQL